MPLPGIDDLDALGGALTDYAPVEDPTTDLSADKFNINNANNAAMTRTVPRALCTFVGHGTTPTDPLSGFIHDAVWGSDVTVKPTPARTGAGIYTLTYPTTIVDELGNTHTINLRRAKGHVEGATAYLVNASITAANVITVYVFDAAGSPNDAVGVNITVEAF